MDASALAMQRVRRFTRFRIKPDLYQETHPVEVSAWAVGREPVPFAEALRQTFEPVA
jgi:alpha-mannosidase